MKIKNYSKFSFLVLFILLIFVLGLSVFDKKESTKVSKINNEICDIVNLYKDDMKGKLSFCFDNTVKLDINSKEIDLNIKNVKDLFYYYDVFEDITYFYLINNSGNVYKTDSNKLFDSNYELEKEKVSKVVNIKTLVDTSSSNELSIYAINEKHEFKLLKKLY